MITVNRATRNVIHANIVRFNLVAAATAAGSVSITRGTSGLTRNGDGRAIGVWPNTFRKDSSFRNRFGRSFGLNRRGDGLAAGLSIGTLKRVFPAIDTFARETRETRLLGTRSASMTVIIESPSIAMDFVLTVWAYLGIARKANALGIDTIHVGSNAILVRDTISRGWLFGDSNNRCGRITAGDSVP